MFNIEYATHGFISQRSYLNVPLDGVKLICGPLLLATI